MPTHYELLHLSTNATTEEIKKSYRRLALIFHPDKNHPLLGRRDPQSTFAVQGRCTESIRAFEQVTEAYSILSDDFRRSIYDSEMGIVGSLLADKRPPSAVASLLSSVEYFRKSNELWDELFQFKKGAVQRRPASRGGWDVPGRSGTSLPPRPQSSFTINVEPRRTQPIDDGHLPLPLSRAKDPPLVVSKSLLLSRATTAYPLRARPGLRSVTTLPIAARMAISCTDENVIKGQCTAEKLVKKQRKTAHRRTMELFLSS